jgi:pantothenate kinase type III
MFGTMSHDPLYLEIGNTTIKLARRAGDGSFDIVRFDDLHSLLAELADEDREILCAPVNERFGGEVIRQIVSDRLRLITRDDLRSFVGDSYDTPETLGLDRILNLIGLGGDGIAISCGTAITVDAVVDGRPRWGAILPGFRTAADGLHERVPALPHVSPGDAVGLPARTSHQSVANGVLLGTALAVRGIVERLAVGRVVATGGDAWVLQSLWDWVKVDEGLLFRGMNQATISNL